MNDARDGSNHTVRTGFAAGVLNALIGIGGGIVIVPALIARGAAAQVAVGTSLAAVVGIGLGAALALWLPADGLEVLFGGFFCFMGIHIGRKALL